MDARRCLLTDELLSPGNNPRAHIIPSALGGRLDPDGLISNETNELLNRKFDWPLIDAYKPIMGLIGGIPDRGIASPIEVIDNDGQRHILDINLTLRPSQPTVTITDQHIDITARNRREAKRILTGIIQKHLTPAAVRESTPRNDLEQKARDDAELILSQAWPVASEPGGTIKVPCAIGPGVSFPAAFVMISLFAAHHGLNPHPQFHEFVRSFQSLKGQLPPDTFYYMPDEPPFSTDAEIAHQLVLIGSAEHMRAYGYVSLFGIEGIAVILPYDRQLDFVGQYAVDVMAGKDIRVRNIEAAKLKLPWTVTHPPGQGAERGFEPSLRRIAQLGDKRTSGGRRTRQPVIRRKF